MNTRVDWLRIIVWTTILVATCAVSSAALWLAQQVAVAVWPWVLAHGDQLTAALLIGLLMVLVAQVLAR